jgi:hypothetical protein
MPELRRKVNETTVTIARTSGSEFEEATSAAPQQPTPLPQHPLGQPMGCVDTEKSGWSDVTTSAGSATSAVIMTNLPWSADCIDETGADGE